MAKIGIFYGSTNGNCESVAEKLKDALGADLHNIADSSADDLAGYDVLVLGSSTWGEGDLQDDWEDGIDKLESIDLSGKTVALFACGDSEGYADSFCGSMSHLYKKVHDKASKVVGAVSTDGYTFDSSDSVVDGKFVGLAIDNENQEDMTDDRVSKWASQIKSEF